MQLLPPEPAAPAPGANSHWCQDLGGIDTNIWDKDGTIQPRCVPDPSGSGAPSRSLDLLNHADPATFLPEEWVGAISACGKLRAMKYPWVDLICIGSAPLRGGLADITFIPREQLAVAKLPASGARLVVDCKGRHLQIRDDLPAEKLAITLKAALGMLVSDQLRRDFPQVSPHSDTYFKLLHCDVAPSRGTKSVHPSFYSVEWTDTGTVWSMVYNPLHLLPSGYFETSCIPDSRRKGAKWASHSKQDRELKRFSRAVAELDALEREMSGLGCSWGGKPGEAPECMQLSERFLASNTELQGNIDWNDSKAAKTARERMARLYEMLADREASEEKSLAYLARAGNFGGIDLTQENKLTTRLEEYCEKNVCNCFTELPLGPRGRYSDQIPTLLVSRRLPVTETLSLLCQDAMNDPECGETAPKRCPSAVTDSAIDYQ